MRKPAITSQADERRFPPEAYEYRDDVTKEAVEKVRQKAAPIVDKAKLVHVDGLGRYSS